MSDKSITRIYENVNTSVVLKITGGNLTQNAYNVFARECYIIQKEAYIEIPETIKRGLPRALEEIWDKVSTTLFGFHTDHTWYTGE